MSLVCVDDNRTIFNRIIHYQRCFNSSGTIIVIGDKSIGKWNCCANLIGVDGICAYGNADRRHRRLMAELSTRSGKYLTLIDWHIAYGACLFIWVEYLDNSLFSYPLRFAPVSSQALFYWFISQHAPSVPFYQAIGSFRYRQLIQRCQSRFHGWR